jgi:hypothetical protein
MDIITGEKIQELCDIFILPNYKIQTRDITRVFLLNKLNYRIDNPKIVFTFTDTFEKSFTELVIRLQLLTNKFVLVVNQSDYKIDERYLSIFDKVPNLLHIYATNINVVHNKITPIPLGIANSNWKHGDLSIINKYIQKLNNINKDKLIYFFFSIDTALNIRNECYNKISKKGIPFLNNTDYDTYINTLSQYKFAISPEGNGIDCHRFWEALYVKTIPICLPNIIVNYYAKYFPVVILNDWDELDISKLEDIYNNADWSNYDKLNMKYIKNMIEQETNIL